MKKYILLLVFFFSLSLTNLQAQNQTSGIGDVIGIWDTITFDNTVSFIKIDTSTQNIWQIGHPQKLQFNSAYSASKTIVTDTVNYYPTKNYSYFDLYIGNFNFQLYPIDIFIDFWHRFDTDTLRDGGYITVSWDKGQSWTNIIQDTNYPYYYFSPMHNSPLIQTPNLYGMNNLLFNGEHGFSGKSNNWVHTTIAWHTMGVKFTIPDTMIVRFNFISDSIQNSREGWMIDNIRLYSVDIGGSVNECIGSNNIHISPNPFVSNTEISFEKVFHSIVLEVIDNQGVIIEKKSFTDCNKISYSSNSLKEGMYLFKITIDKHIVVNKKVIVNK